MKTDIEIKNDVYNLLRESGLMESVTGKLSKTIRQTELEDVVISILDNTAYEVQEGFVNVNVYVKDVTRNGQQEENTARTLILAPLFASFFRIQIGTDYRITLDKQRILSSEGSHVISNKILYKHLNE